MRGHFSDGTRRTNETCELCIGRNTTPGGQDSGATCEDVQPGDGPIRCISPAMVASWGEEPLHSVAQEMLCALVLKSTLSIFI